MVGMLTVIKSARPHHHVMMIESPASNYIMMIESRASNYIMNL